MPDNSLGADDRNLLRDAVRQLREAAALLHDAQALRGEVLAIRREVIESRGDALRALQSVHEFNRVHANNSGRERAMLAAVLAAVQGCDAQDAFDRSHAEFRQDFAEVYDPLLWGVRPDWLARLTMGPGQVQGDG